MHPIVFNQLKEKLYTRFNHHEYLLSVCGKTIQGKDCSKKVFPYWVDTAHEAVAQPILFSGGSCNKPDVLDDRPHYVVMIPMVLPKSWVWLNSLIIRFFKEACETVDQKKRTTLVIGVNVRRGLDSSMLNRLHNLYKDWKRPSFSCVVMGFTWDPQYTLNVSDWTYDVYKTYRIMHLIDYKTAIPIKVHFEHIKVNIPYVNIREAIYRANATKAVFEKFLEGKNVFYGIADPDAKSFNHVIKGADIELEKFKEEKGDYPDIFSPGYEASSDESPVIQLGFKIDRKIRSETNRFFGMGSYFSETFFLFRIKKTLSDHTFVSQETKKNQALESRRLFQNGVRKGVIDPDKTHHGGDFPIQTAVMERSKTAFTEKRLEMNKENLYSTEALKCLCGLTYSNLHPREWANNLYVALPEKASNTQSIILPMQMIYKAVHPIYVAYELLGRKFSPNQFRVWLERFHAYASCIDTYWSSSSID
ncbi:MAG: hypothetical protein ACK4HV_06070, partial [Parachlamydiaceae bacterium]